jgi:competence protein ComEC
VPEVIVWYGLGVSVLEWVILKIKGRPSWVIERESFKSDRLYARTEGQSFNPGKIGRLKTLFLAIALVFLIGSLGLSAGRIIAERLDPRIHFTVIDVSHGQSIFIRFPDNRTMLIDGGGLYRDGYDIGRFVVSPFLLSRGRKTLDVVVLTHPHPDHGNGLRYILRHFRVREFWTIADKNMLSEELIGIANDRGIPVRIIDRDWPDKEFAGARVSILNPGPGKPEQGADLTDRSIVLKISFGETGFLVPADINKRTEAELVEIYGSSGLLRSDILVAPHHGSRSSSSSAFLKAVAPTHAIFSARHKSWFKLPSSSVLRRYEKLGIKTWRTDENGAVTIKTDGKDYMIESYMDSH